MNPLRTAADGVCQCRRLLKPAHGAHHKVHSNGTGSGASSGTYPQAGVEGEDAPADGQLLLEQRLRGGGGGEAVSAAQVNGQHEVEQVAPDAGRLPGVHGLEGITEGLGNTFKSSSEGWCEDHIS